MTAPLYQAITLTPSQGNRIRRSIAKSPHTQRAVAKLVGMEPQHLNNVLAGTRPIDAERLAEVGKLCGLRISARLDVTISPVTS